MVAIPIKFATKLDCDYLAVKSLKSLYNYEKNNSFYRLIN